MADSLLRRPSHIPEKARFPAIDAHNHLFADMPADRMRDIMDAVGVRVFVNVTGNCSLPFDTEGYTIAAPGAFVLHAGMGGAMPRPLRRVHDGGVRPVGTTSPWTSTRVSPRNASPPWRAKCGRARSG